MMYDCEKFQKEIIMKLHKLKMMISQLPEWISLADMAREKGLSPQAVRKQLLNGRFEHEVDFKYINCRIYIARNAIFRIKRIRK